MGDFPLEVSSLSLSLSHFQWHTHTPSLSLSLITPLNFPTSLSLPLYVDIHSIFSHFTHTHPLITLTLTNAQSLTCFHTQSHSLAHSLAHPQTPNFLLYHTVEQSKRESSGELQPESWFVHQLPITFVNLFKTTHFFLSTVAFTFVVSFQCQE